MKLEDISTGASLRGVEPTAVVSVVAVVLVGEGTVQLIYRTCGWRIANRPHDPGRYHVL